jgi:Zn-dependent peptidase ImmA (M78 family)
MVLPEHKSRVREIAARFSTTHPSTEPLDLAAAVGVKLEYGDLGDKDGAFDPSRNVIFLNRASGVERQRFTMAHEITHFLILRDDDLLSDLHDAYEGEALEEAIEILCNVGASAILVPEAELEVLLHKYGRGARVLPRIAQSFNVSRPAACVALAQHLESKAVVAILRAKGKTVKKTLEVQFSTKTADMRYSLSNGTVIPLDHPAMTALETGLPLVEKNFIPFRSGKKMPAMVDVHPEGILVYAVFTLLGEAPETESKPLESASQDLPSS